MKKSLIFIAAILAFSNAFADEVHYVISDRTPVSRMVQFSIPYSMGTHEGVAHSIQGAVVTDENDNVKKAEFLVPIDSIRTGDSIRDCHLREALGIDYSASVFPKEHVCDSNNMLPSSGRDSVQYSNIKVEFQEIVLPQDPYKLGVPKMAAVKVKINIHGVERVQEWPVSITKTVGPTGAEGFKLISQFRESLKDFNIQVKPLKMGFISIGVKDTVSVKIALDLARK